MGKNKKVSGQHVSPRKTVQFPEDWFRVAQELASARPMPVAWLLIELVKTEAESKGKKPLPAVPWQLPPGGATPA